MKHLKLILVAAASAALLSACATPTPYGPATANYAHAPGYKDQRLEDNRYRLTFSGNDLTSRETVENYMLYRAAELTLDAGYDWFEIVKRDTDKKTRVVDDFDRDPFYYGMSWRFYGRSRWSTWGLWGDPFADMDRTEYTRYEASAEILMHKGPKPEVVNAYDARSVKGNLDSKIVRPAPPRQ